MSNRALLPDLINALAEKTGISKTLSEKFCRQFYTIIREALLREGYVKVKGFGTFKLITVGERESVDVNTGQRIAISSHTKITFTPDKVMAARVNRPFANFETSELEEDVAPIVAEETVEEVVTGAADTSTTDAEQEDTGVHTIFLGDMENPESEEPVVEKVVPVVEDVIRSEAPTIEESKEDSQEEISQVVSPVTEEVIEETEEPEEEHQKSAWWKKLLYSILTLLLLVGAYYVGYYQLIGNTDLPLPKETIEKPYLGWPSNMPSGAVDSISVKNDSVEASLVVNQEKEEGAVSQDWTDMAKKYEQIEGGEYLIVGELETHEMGRGESIIRLAQKLYGSKEMYRYVIFYNHISNPDIVHVGQKVVFPKLVKK